MINRKSFFLELFKKHSYIICLLFIIAIAIIYRFYQLNNLPPGLNPSEANNGIDALKILHNHDFRLIYNSGGPREALFIYIQAIFIAIIGNTILALRILPAIIGVLTVIVTFYLAKSWFGQRVAFIAAFLMAVSPWAITFSRDNFSACMLPLLITLTLWLYTIALKNKRLIWYVLSGICLGAGMYTYIAFRFFPLALCFIAIILLIINRKLFKAHIHSITIVFLTTLIVLLPLLFYGLRHSNEITANAGASSFLSKDLNHGKPIQTLLTSIGKTALMFNFRGDENYRHNLSGQPMLNFFVGIMFILGLLIAISKIKTPKYFLLLIVFLFMLLPEIITVEGVPHSLRAIGVIPVVFILSAIGVSYMIDSWNSTFPINSAAKTSGLLAIILLFTLTAYQGYKQYFVVWADNSQTYKIFSEDAVAMSNMLIHDGKNSNNYVFIDNYNNRTIQYLCYGKVKYINIDTAQNITKLISKSKSKLFLLAENYKGMITILKQNYPNGRLLRSISTHDNKELFIIYKVNE